MGNLIPEFTIGDSLDASELTQKHIGSDIGFAFIDPESRIHTSVIGELRSIYHTADSVTLDLAPLTPTDYVFKEFAQLPLDTDIHFITIDEEGRS
ncbi:hypothetical protein [Corynebacterium glutamicum]|uniref:hypothetical protein n=1 Tax=Corynebacterium glutamicum TaxID=1718 RepID=UPI001B8CD9E2|nr:hypothetical protein [Corynebacterium glutamicum]